MLREALLPGYTPLYADIVLRGQQGQVSILIRTARQQLDYFKVPRDVQTHDVDSCQPLVDSKIGVLLLHEPGSSGWRLSIALQQQEQNTQMKPQADASFVD